MPTDAPPPGSRPPAPVSAVPAPVSGVPAPVSAVPAPVSGVPVRISSAPVPIMNLPAPGTLPPAPPSGAPPPGSGPPVPRSGAPPPGSLPPAPRSSAPPPGSGPPPPKLRLSIGSAAWLPREGFLVVPLWPPALMPDTTRARSALVGRAGGRLVAYANLCRHLAVPLDFGDGDVHDDDKGELHCRRHGAVFDAGSGACTTGPCVGRSLWPIELEIDPFGEVHLVFDGEPPPRPPQR
ncbi:MAG TPA: Rieske (2Fe-2S) protein [Polyangiaceae bacterium]|nr:Rieske (2Fe-2S) protein [Polyangiaceae bacterium]